MASRNNMCTKKRTNTLIKKNSELATLCGTDSLIIILEHDPRDQFRPIRSHSWPEHPNQINRIFNRLRDYEESKGGDRKRRRIGGGRDRTVKSVTGDNHRANLGLVESKLARLEELNAADRIRCGNVGLEEIFARSYVCSHDWSPPRFEQNMIRGCVGSSEEECIPVGISYDWGWFDDHQLDDLLLDGRDSGSGGLEEIVAPSYVCSHDWSPLGLEQNMIPVCAASSEEERVPVGIGYNWGSFGNDQLDALLLEGMLARRIFVPIGDSDNYWKILLMLQNKV